MCKELSYMRHFVFFVHIAKIQMFVNYFTDEFNIYL